VLDSLKYVKSAKAATDVPTTVSSDQSVVMCLFMHPLRSPNSSLNVAGG
jgi:hypothetical protein